MERDSKGRFAKKTADKVYAVGFKGFDPDMKCRGRQYAENQTFEQGGEIELCNNGIHFCENPFDVWDYYGLLDADARPNTFAPVTAEAPCKTDGSKIVTSRLKIGFKLDLVGFCKASFEYLAKVCGDVDPGYDSKQSQSGEGSKQSQSGDYSQQSQSGNFSKQSQSGEGSKQSQSGYDSKQSQSGDYSQQSQSGNFSKQSQSGACSMQSQSGYGSRQVSVGAYNAAYAEANDCLVAVLGPNGRVRGRKGCVLVLANYREGKDRRSVIDSVVSAKVDGKKIKEDIWYKLEKGKFVEAN